MKATAALRQPETGAGSPPGRPPDDTDCGGDRDPGGSARPPVVALTRLPVPVFVKDLSGVFVTCNDAFLAFLGRSRAEVIGRTAFDLAPADLAETYHRADVALMARGGRQVYETDVQTAMRGPRRVRFDKSVLRDEASGEALIAGLIFDLEDDRPSGAPPTPTGMDGRQVLDGIIGRFMVALGQSGSTETGGPLRTLLDQVGSLLDVDRATILALPDGGDAASPLPATGKTWARDGMPPHARPLVDGPLDEDLPWLAACMEDGGGLGIVPDRLDLPPEAPRERTRLDAAGIRAALVAPLRGGRTVFGLLCLDMATRRRDWSAFDITAARMLAHTLSHALDRARMEKVMRASERNFRAFFDSMNDMITVTTPDGRILTGNRALIQTLHHDAETLTTLTVADLHPPEMRDQARTLFAELVAGERDVCPLPMMTRDGRQIPAETRIWPGVWDARPCIFGVSKNLTAEREAEDWFERLFRNNPAPMALNRLSDGAFLQVNEAFESTTGYHRDEVLGRTIATMGLFADPSEGEAFWAAVASTSRLRSHELGVRRKDGAIRHGLFHAEPLEGPDGPILLSVMIDVTARKQAEEALARSETQVRLALEATSDGLWDWNVSADVVTWHPRCFTMLGYRPDAFSLSFEHWRDLLHPDDRAACEARITESLAEGRAFSLEMRLRRADGGWLWILGRGKPVAWDSAGQPTRMVGTQTDIDAMKRVEQSLTEARVAAEQASLAKSEFLASMSHELRTPLNSIIGFSTLLVDGHLGPLQPDKAVRYLSDIRGSGEHLLALINDILDLSAVEIGKLAINSEILDVAALCRDSLGLVTVSADQAGVVLDLDLPAALPALVADARRGRQVLLNLLSNAIKYTDAGDRVTLWARPTPEGGLALGVSDPGIGMDAEGLAKAMRPFERVDNVMSRRHDGIGLGLPLSARLMALHGGTLTLDSAPGEGTVATATFPPERVGASAAETPTDPPPS